MCRQNLTGYSLQCGTKSLPDTLSYHIKVPVPGLGFLFSSYMSVWTDTHTYMHKHTHTHTLYVIPIAFDYPLVFDGKFILQKSPHAWIISHWEIKLVPIQKLLSLLLVSRVVEGSSYTTREEIISLTQLWALWITTITGLTKYITDAIVAWILWEKLSDGIYSLLCKTEFKVSTINWSPNPSLRKRNDYNY